jgi:hypothetical protein
MPQIRRVSPTDVRHHQGAELADGGRIPFLLTELVSAA